MASNIVRKKLIEVANIVDSLHQTPKYCSKGIPMVRVTDVRGGTLDLSGCLMVSEEDYNKYTANHVPMKGDIVISRVGTYGNFSYVESDAPFCLGQNTAIISPRINNRYLYYALVSPVIKQQIEQMVVGATQKTISLKNIKALEIPVFDDYILENISGILSAIDNKININNEINDNLQQQIRTLCSAWLNDYVPFGGVCPDDWELTPLASIAKFISGYSYKGTELQDSNIAMATIKNFDRKGGFKLDGYKEIVPSNKLKSEHHAELFDTLVAHTDLTQNAEVIGNAEPVLSFSGYDDIIFSMDVVKVIPDTPSISKFLIAAMLQTQKFKDHCLGYINGTTVLHLSKKALPEYLLKLPHDFTVIQPLDDAVSSMYQQMALNIDESVRLAALRNSLLPKLMSGEIDVSGISI